MAAAISYYEATMTGSRISLSSVVGRRVWPTDISIRAGKTNANDVFIGADDVTVATGRGAYISAREAWGISLSQARVSTDDVYVIGTAPDTIFITLVE